MIWYGALNRKTQEQRRESKAERVMLVLDQEGATLVME